MTVQAPYDVLVVGAGHNGLVAATVLARAGRRVLVLERRSIVGGAAVTEEFHPGFRGSPGASLCGLLRPEIVQELALVPRGLQLLPLDPEVVALGEDGKVLRLWRDPARAAQEIGAFSPRDAAAFPRFRSLLVSLASVADPLLDQAPPEVSDWRWADQLRLARRGLTLRRMGKDAMYASIRMVPMSLRAFLGEWFETDLLRATLAVDALVGTFRGPYSPETAFGLLHHYAPAVHGAAWSVVRGGMGRLAALLAAASLAGCGSGYFGGSEDKVPLKGERISVLSLDTTLKPDKRIPDVEVRLPRPYRTADWPQPGGGRPGRA